MRPISAETAEIGQKLIKYGSGTEPNYRLFQNHADPSKNRALFRPSLAVSLSACSVTSVLKVVVAVSSAIITVMEEFGPPASELANFDAAEANRFVDLQNVSLTSTNGNVLIRISDETTGQTLGQQSFGYSVVGGNQLVFTNPAAVNSFIHSFADYQDGAGFVLVEFETEFETSLPGGDSSGQVSVTTNYDGVPISSASGSIPADGGGGGCWPNCEVQ